MCAAVFAISLSTAAVSPWAAAAASTYTVRSGDTLFAIALRYHSTVAALQAANGLHGSLIRPGERLVLPGSVPTASSRTARPDVYRVRAGDTLSGIAQRFGVSLASLYRLNGLDSQSILHVGQRIRIVAPERAVGAARSGGTYTVRPGDTLRSIAAKEGLSLSALTKLNPVAAVDLRVGTVLRLSTSVTRPVQRASRVTLSSFGDRVAAEVQRYLGVPYVWGGTSPRGFDCSGLVQYVFRQLGVMIPRDATEQYYAGTPVARADLQPGDLVFFDTEGGISHVGIYIGNGEFVDAPTTGQNVTVMSLYNPYWEATYIGARALGPMMR
jgi:peptidoglycan DL-endopeptidase LytE